MYWNICKEEEIARIGTSTRSSPLSHSGSVFELIHVDKSNISATENVDAFGCIMLAFSGEIQSKFFLLGLSSVRRLILLIVVVSTVKRWNYVFINFIGNMSTVALNQNNLLSYQRFIGNRRHVCRLRFDDIVLIKILYSCGCHTQSPFHIKIGNF